MKKLLPALFWIIPVMSLILTDIIIFLYGFYDWKPALIIAVFNVFGIIRLIEAISKDWIRIGN